MKFSGIDLHANSVVVITDEADRIVFQRRLPNDLQQIVLALAAYREELVGVVVVNESMVRLLMSRTRGEEAWKKTIRENLFGLRSAEQCQQPSWWSARIRPTK